MTRNEMTYEGMKTLIGKRVEIPVHYDLWMRGARFGTVIGRRQSTMAGCSDYLLVRMDHPQVRRCGKVWAPDVEFMRIHGDARIA